MAASTAYSTARWFSTGKAPGKPRHIGQIWVFGSPPNRLAQPQKALVFVSSCTWTSSPMTGSYRSNTSGERLVVVAVITFDSSNRRGWNDSILPDEFLPVGRFKDRRL